MRRRLSTAALLAGVAAALLTGCGGAEEPPLEQPTTLQPTEAPAEPTSEGADPTGSPTDVPENVQAAIDDLAERLGVPATSIQPGPLEQVTWSDSSLGCPSPGTSYAQVLTDGYRVVLTADGQEYAYHAGADGELFYCADPRDPVTPETESS